MRLQTNHSTNVFSKQNCNDPIVTTTSEAESAFFFFFKQEDNNDYS
jgi:hypothetical protein